MVRLLAGLLFASTLAGCQSSVEYLKIGPGPDLAYAHAQCEILAMQTEQGYIAWGSAEHQIGAAIGNAISNDIRKAQFMRNCMVLQGYQQVPGKPPTTQTGPAQ